MIILNFHIFIKITRCPSKEECVVLKEKLNRAALSKDVLEQEKLHLMEILSRTEAQKEEVESEGRIYSLFARIKIRENKACGGVSLTIA